MVALDMVALMMVALDMVTLVMVALVMVVNGDLSHDDWIKIAVLCTIPSKKNNCREDDSWVVIGDLSNGGQLWPIVSSVMETFVMMTNGDLQNGKLCNGCLSNDGQWWP